MGANRKVYLDNQATTPLDKRVLDAMIPVYESAFGNPMSKHFAGRNAHDMVEKAREIIALLISVNPEEVIFTSGATESINMAIKGIAFGLKNKGNHIITSRIEHKAVLECCRFLQSEGFEISYVEVDANGIISRENLEKEISANTILIAIGHANNEIGAIQDIAMISKTARKNNIHFFSDCAQSFGKIPFDAKLMDSFAFSGHKLYGPMGSGGLFIGMKWQSDFKKSIHGGGQEFGFRPGTHNVVAIIGLAEACRIAWEEMRIESERIKALRDTLWKRIKSELNDVELNGGMDNRLCGNINFSISSVPSELIINKLSDQFAFSTGSACMSAVNEPSYVIMALGKNREVADSAIRISIGRFNTEEDIDIFARSFIDTINYIKNITHF
jgi:cysteine desulfurase